MPLLKSPTLKQKMVVKEYFATGSKSKAVSRVYNTRDPKTYAAQVFKMQGVQYLMRQELEKRGLNAGQLSEGFKSMLKKSKPKGRINDPRLHFDLLKETAKLAGLYPAEKKQVETKNANLNVDLNGKSEKEMLDALSDLQNQIADFRKMVAETEKQRTSEDGEVL